MEQNRTVLGRALKSFNLGISGYPCAPAPNLRAVPVYDHDINFHHECFWLSDRGEKVGMIKQMSISVSTYNTVGTGHQAYPAHTNQLVENRIASHEKLTQSCGRGCRSGDAYADVIAARFYLRDALKRLRILFLKEFQFVSRVLRKYAKLLRAMPAISRALARHRQHIWFPAPMEIHRFYAR